MAGRPEADKANVGGQLVSASSNRDIGYSPDAAWRRALEMSANIARNPSRTLPMVIEEMAKEFGSAPAFVLGDESLTYNHLAERSRGYSQWALRQGLKTGDCVGLLMPNSLDYMAIWLGITRIGCIVSLINTNLVGDALAHSINVVSPRCVIVGIGLVGTVAAVLPRLESITRWWIHGGNYPGFRRVDTDMEGLGRFNLAEHHAPTLSDTALYVYTSGTTGLPKAAVVSHFRLMQWSYWFAGMLDTRSTDRMYNCLPMYHSIGGIAANGAVLVKGGAVVLRSGFSARRFWDDIIEGNCTLFQYVGELCRYLADSPPHLREREHSLRLCCGNGLRADVWERFQRRFQIPRILEFYAATEGNFSLYNCEGKVGAIGRIPAFLAHRVRIVLIKFDVETGEPLRNHEGFCIRCTANEPGEALCKLTEGNATLTGRFEGYSDGEASERKILRNVFSNGDAWYRSGDLMIQDQGGYFYFVDRVGDTFRWKGENVSTTEVADAVIACDGVLDAVVYGVRIPGTEGRIGMAATVVSKDFDLNQFWRQLTERLPDYARPAFLRICGQIAATGTFKPQKQLLVREGYDPSVTADSIYFSRSGFVRLDERLYQSILNGELRL
jgi:fatty-acyl-CoA synthase